MRHETMSDETRRDELAEVRSHLRETWPSLTDADVDAIPRTRREALAVLQERTGDSLENLEIKLSELFGLVPERHEPSTD